MNSLTSITSNPTPRIYAFRTLIVVSIACFISELGPSRSPDIWWRTPGTYGIVLAFTIAHHVISTFHLRFLYELFDWVLVSLEIAGWFALGSYRIVVDRWSSLALVVLVGGSYIQLFSLLSLWIFRTAAIMTSHGRNLLLPFNLLSGCPSLGGYNRRSILVGRSLWRSPLRGESRAIQGFRVLVAMFLLAGFFLFSVYAMVIEPIRETGTMPTKSYRGEFVGDINMEMPVWSIVAFMDMAIPAAQRVDDFKAAVNVTPLWDTSVVSSQPPCVHSPGNKTFGGLISGVSSYPHIQTITIFCPSLVSSEGSPVTAMLQNDALVSPDLLITVNFTVVGITSDSLIDMRRRTISILVGLTNHTGNVLSNTPPTPLIPDLHLHGTILRAFKRQYKRPSVQALDIFTPLKTFQVSNIVALVPDPSPLIPRGANTATLRLSGQDDFSDWVIDEDYREKSLWAGFAAVGGFWAFINGTFVILFGGSLMLLLCGIKPLSVFGIVHCFQRDRLLAAWRKDFPRIRTEGGQPSTEQAGLLAFLRERLIDLDPIDHEAVDSADSQRRVSVTIHEPPSHIEMTVPKSPRSNSTDAQAAGEIEDDAGEVTATTSRSPSSPQRASEIVGYSADNLESQRQNPVETRDPINRMG